MDHSNENTTEIYIVGLSGSLRERSYTRMAISYALKDAEEFGAQTRMLNLCEYALAFAEIQDHTSSGVKQMRQDIQAAHGIILGTPEYHGSFSGVLKHALDLMGFDEFEGKLIGMVDVAGGRLGAINSLNSLRTVGCALLHNSKQAQVFLHEWEIAQPNPGGYRD